MGIKAASITTPYNAGDSDFTPSSLPDVPIGYTRYPTNIATADTTGETSIFFGLSTEDGMYIDVEDSITVLLEGGFATGFLIVPSPITTTVYYYYPSTQSYVSDDFVLIGSSSLGSIIPQSVVSNIKSGITSSVSYVIKFPIYED